MTKGTNFSYFIFLSNKTLIISAGGFGIKNLSNHGDKLKSFLIRYFYRAEHCPKERAFFSWLLKVLEEYPRMAKGQEIAWLKEESM